MDPLTLTPESARPGPAASPQRGLSRRKFLGGAAAVGGAAFLYTWRIEPHWVEVVRRSLPVVGLPDSLVGKRIVQISDVHAGPVVDQNYLLRSAESVAELRPDLLVLTGDFITLQSDDCVAKTLDFIRALPKPPLGRLAVLGNHDYGFYWRQQRVADLMTDELEALEVQVLRNATADVAGLQVAGIDDYFTRNFHPELAMAGLDFARPAITLVHNPDGVDRPGWGDYRGWILCGHTHGGQCKPPLLPPPFLPLENRRYVAGEYDLGDGRRLYVNRGLGYLHRVRFNCRPEITVFTLEPAAA